MSEAASHIESLKVNEITDRFNICLVDPALMPAWFWQPTAHALEEKGHNVYVPDLRRNDDDASVERSVDAIEAAMGDAELQFLVVLSRGVEPGVRYVHRLAQQKRLGKLMGWMVISSVGPRGYEYDPTTGDKLAERHTESFVNGFEVREDGLSYLKYDVAMQGMLAEVQDPDFRHIIATNLVADRPLSDKEVSDVPDVSGIDIPSSWYIGSQDKVDNLELSELVAKRRFGVTPTSTDWGHIGPLSHAEEVAEAITAEAAKAYVIYRENHK